MYLDDVHGNDRVEIADRLGSATHDSEITTPVRQIENVIASLDVLSSILERVDAPKHLIVGISTIGGMLFDTYMMGYRWVIEGKSPSKAEPPVSPSDYLSKFGGNYSLQSDKSRIATIWDDIQVMLRGSAFTFETLMAQKFRTFACDCAVLSVLGAIYGTMNGCASLDDDMQALIRQFGDETSDNALTEYNPRDRKDIVADLGVRSRALESVYANSDADLVTRIQNVVALRTTPISISELALACGTSPMLAESEANRLVRLGRIEMSFDGYMPLNIPVAQPKSKVQGADENGDIAFNSSQFAPL